MCKESEVGVVPLRVASHTCMHSQTFGFTDNGLT
jgi:hypothetical protein